MWIKICANTNLDDAQLAAELGADAVGFVFAPSKRRVTVAQVAAITPHLPGNVEKVGVFAPGDDEMLDDAIETAGLTAVQLHGALDEWLLDGLQARTEGKVDVFQVIGVETESDDTAAALARFEDRLRRAVTHPAVNAVLLDAARAGASGGLGLAFDWAATAEIVQRVYAAPGAKNRPRLIIAGGLNPGNVGGAIRAFAPFGVDVASGVEVRPGRKDPAKLREFIDAARGTRSPRE